MKLLILGGTKFLGRHIAQAALAKGHDLTLFHRGQTNPDLFPDVEHIHGDREHDLGKLAGRQWDAVIDTCGYFPRVVRLSCEALKGSTGHYNFISSISVYDDVSSPPTEESTVGKIEDETVEEITGESYGPLKALCEQVVQATFGERALIVRPGLIVGPNDPSDRFTYWPVRMARGGQVVVPDRRSQPVQIIDVRDLAEWCVGMADRRVSGVFNATGPERPYELEDFLNRIAAAANGQAHLVWVDTSLLETHKVEPWSDLPCVLPYDGSMDGMSASDISRALAQGLKFRGLEETTRDTLEWWEQSGQTEMKAGLSRDKEAELLSALNAPEPSLAS